MPTPASRRALTRVRAQNSILKMENGVPDAGPLGRAVDRSLERRRVAAADEVRRLVDAGFALIRETGDLEPRVGEIVRAAGLSNQAFYRHFRSKHELLVAVLDEGIRTLRDYLAHRMAAAPDAEAAVAEWLRGLCAQALDAEAAAATRPFALSRARLGEHFPDEVGESERQLTGLVRERLAEASAAGALPGCDPERDAERLYDLAMGWMQRRLLERVEAEPDDAEHLVTFAMAGLRRSGDGG